MFEDRVNLFNKMVVQFEMLLERHVPDRGPNMMHC